MAFSSTLCSAMTSRGNVAFDSTEEDCGEWCQSSRMNVIASESTAHRTSRIIWRAAGVPPPESGLGSSQGACPYLRPPADHGTSRGRCVWPARSTVRARISAVTPARIAAPCWGTIGSGLGHCGTWRLSIAPADNAYPVCGAPEGSRGRLQRRRSQPRATDSDE